MLRLSRLSRAKSINVRHTTPGHANPHFLDRPRFIDPSHPAAKLALRNLPSFVCPQFTIRAFPNPILHEPVDFVPINPLLATGLVRARTKPRGPQKWWSKLDIQINTGTNATRTTSHAMKRHTKFIAARQVADARVAALAESGRHNISLLFHTSKKATSKSCVIRRRLRSKMTAAIDLVVGRSADAVGVPETNQQRSYPPLKLVSHPLQENERLVLQDWTYVVIPGLAIYKTPLPILVQAVRKALLSLSHQSMRLESSWSALPKAKSRSSQRLPVDRQLPSTRSPPNVVRTSQSVIQTPRRLYPLLRPSECAHAPREPAKHDTTSTRLYSHRPIVLPHEKPDVKK